MHALSQTQSGRSGFYRSSCSLLCHGAAARQPPPNLGTLIQPSQRFPRQRTQKDKRGLVSMSQWTSAVCSLLSPKGIHIQLLLVGLPGAELQRGTDKMPKRPPPTNIFPPLLPADPERKFLLAANIPPPISLYVTDFHCHFWDSYRGPRSGVAGINGTGYAIHAHEQRSMTSTNNRILHSHLHAFIRRGILHVIIDNIPP